MSRLPDRPNTDQLRRQARELHRAAADGDTRALERLRQVSDKVTLSAAQLAIARDYGFPSWPRLKAAAERRRAEAPRPIPVRRPAARLRQSRPAARRGRRLGRTGTGRQEHRRAN